MFESFQNPSFASNFFPEPTHFQKYFFEQSAQSDVFKELWVPILKGLKHPNIVLLETNSLKTLLDYATNGRLVSLLH